MQGFDPKKYAGKNLKEEDVMKMKECFDIFDYDHSGNISPDELINTIRALGIEEQAKQIINIVTNQTTAEELDFGLFLEIFGFSDSQSENSLQQLYEMFDTRGTGCFGPEDFEKVAASVGENFSTADVDQMIDYADRDRDGGISYEEFVSVVTREFPKVWSRYLNIFKFYPSSHEQNFKFC